MDKSYIFWIAAFLSILFWGAYPSLVIVAGFPDPFFGAAVAIGLAALGWLIIILTQGVSVSEIARISIKHRKVVIFSGFLFATELALFFPVVARSPQTAAVLFELWVVAFVLASSYKNILKNVSKKEWIFLIFGFCGATIAVVDWTSLEHEKLTAIDTISAIMASSAAICMGVKTFMNASLAENLKNIPALSASTLPHFLSAIVAVPIWAALFLYNHNPLPAEHSWLISGIPIFLIYFLGVPIFILGVRYRPNESSMAIFYLIPLVALLLLSIIGNTQITVYFVIGASIVFISNTLLTQKMPYVSASGLTAIMTLIATWLAISIENGSITPFFSIPQISIGISAAESFIVFYGLIFGFMLSDVLTDIKEFKNSVNSISYRISMIAGRNEEFLRLYRSTIQYFSAEKPTALLRARLLDACKNTEAHDLFSASLSRKSTSSVATTPYAIFRILSIGFLILIFFVYCASTLLLDRLIGILLFATVFYFLLFSRSKYIRKVVFQAVVEETILQFRTNGYLEKVRGRRSNHRLGLALLMFSLLMSFAVNIYSEPTLILDLN